MNTPAHVAINGFLLGRGRFARAAWPLALGALLPDLPMIAFYLHQRVWLRLPERAIWSHSYFQPGWQALFDAFHSLPLIALAGLIGWRMRRTGLLACAASMALHSAFDLALHNEDAHGHLWPFTAWRFRSPVSYWDPSRHGGTFALIELVASLAACVALWRRGGSWRSVAAASAALYGVGAALALWWWSGMHA